MIGNASTKGEPTLLEIGSERLSGLCRSIGVNEQPVIDLFEKILFPWGYTAISSKPEWPSLVGDDNTPFDFSFAIGGASQIRLLAEPLGSPPSLESNKESALRLIDSLIEKYGGSRKRLDAVSELFFPSNPKGRFAIWLAADMGSDGPLRLKVYLNPESQGREKAAQLTEEALSCLGLGSAWSIIAKRLMRRGPYLDEIKYFSLDLSAAESARVKIYVLHHSCTLDDLEFAAGGCPDYRRGDITEFLESVAPGLTVFNERRAPFTCYAFLSDVREPYQATTHFPINSYASNDEEIRARVVNALARFGLPGETYSKAIQGFANRPLENGIGMHAYVSFRRERESPKITVYLPVEAYHPGFISQTSPAPSLFNPIDLLNHFAEDVTITNHPFFNRLSREPINLKHHWVLLANLSVSITKNVSGYLSDMLTRTEDVRVRNLLKKQLFDETGQGSNETSHPNLISDTLHKIKEWRPKGEDASLLDPGYRWSKRLDAVFRGAFHEAVGAIMVGEIFSNQLNRFLMEQFSRQSSVDLSSLHWLNIHSSVEPSHVDDSIELARLLPNESNGEVSKGGFSFAVSAWSFLDDLYAICFEED